MERSRGGRAPARIGDHEERAVREAIRRLRARSERIGVAIAALEELAEVRAARKGPPRPALFVVRGRAAG